MSKSIRTREGDKFYPEASWASWKLRLNKNTHILEGQRGDLIQTKSGLKCFKFCKVEPYLTSLLNKSVVSSEIQDLASAGSQPGLIYLGFSLIFGKGA